MTDRPVLVLDNEAVQALLDHHHRRHREVISLVEFTAADSRRPGGPAPVVPTVRVEAGWDRQSARAASINRLHVADVPLDRHEADRASRLVRALRVSVTDAHLGATMAAVGACTVVTGDVDDVRRMAEHLDVPVRIVRL